MFHLPVQQDFFNNTLCYLISVRYYYFISYKLIGGGGGERRRAHANLPLPHLRMQYSNTATTTASTTASTTTTTINRTIKNIIYCQGLPALVIFYYCCWFLSKACSCGV